MAAASADAAILLYDKPAGVTSHDVVAKVRRERGVKVGHAGTLDPFATGLLLILLGRATRLQRYLLALPKAYRATARLGWRSSTGDADGELERTGRLPEDLSLPTGRVRQRVPMTSAVRVGGERLYRKAHRGEEVETPEREITVSRADLLEHDGDRAVYEIECSSGTYIRALVETLHDAYCEELRRIAIGAHRVEDAGSELTPAEALSFLPQVEVSEDQAEAVRHGRRLPGSSWQQAAGSWQEAGPVALVHEGALIAVARGDGEELRYEVVLG